MRAYNASWDFYKGMSQDQIEDEIRRSTTWQRQTWPLGAKTGNKHFTFSMHDPLGVFEEEAEEMKKPVPARPHRKKRPCACWG